MGITFRVHWLTLTIWADKFHALKMWGKWFESYLGPLEPIRHGGRGFKSLHKAFLETKLYSDPIGQPEDPYSSLEFPGSACDALPDATIQEFLSAVRQTETTHVTRVDLAWDGASFTPELVKEAVQAKQIRSYLRRKNWEYSISPEAIREDGQIGTSSLRLGSNHSERLLRVYDKHGPVRVELQTRNERADLVTWDVLVRPVEEWFTKALGHLRDYIDFIDLDSQRLLPWWESFVTNTQRSGKTITDAREIELSRKIAWFDQQVSPTFSLLVDVLGKQVIEAFAVSGRRKRGNKYNALLSTYEQHGRGNEH